MRAAVIGAVLLLVGVVALATGALPGDEFAALTARVGPILVFVLAITVTTELAAEAGLFDVVARRLAAWGRGRTLGLWAMTILFATVGTVFLSLDTTAVLVTPVVVILARRSGLDPIPFALTTIWLANTASLLLPVSNLTNLLAQERLGNFSVGEFASLMAAPAAVAIVVPVLVIGLVYRRSLATRYTPPPGERVADPRLLWASAAVIAVLVPLLVTPIPVWMSATGAAVILGVAFAALRPRALSFSLVPWQLLLFASGLFLVVEAGHSLGLADLLADAVGRGTSTGDLLRLAGIGGSGANLVNNLPAYLALEPLALAPLAEGPTRLAALLIGVNAGPLITPWASLATLLWHDRLTRLGVEFSWRRYLALGLVVAPVTVVLSTLALAASTC